MHKQRTRAAIPRYLNPSCATHGSLQSPHITIMRITAFNLFFAQFKFSDGPFPLDVGKAEWKLLTLEEQKFWQRVAEFAASSRSSVTKLKHSQQRPQHYVSGPYHSPEAELLAQSGFFHPQATTSWFPPSGDAEPDILQESMRTSVRGVEGWDVRVVDALLNGSMVSYSHALSILRSHIPCRISIPPTPPPTP